MKHRKSSRKPETAAELLSEIGKNSDHSAMARQNEINKKADLNKSLDNEIPIIGNLKSAGYIVDTIADLYNKNMHYESAIPILLSWLPKADDLGVKQSLIRALTVPWAKPIAACALVNEFRHASDTTGEGIKWVIANALSVVADDSVFDDIVDLIDDKRNLKSREMLVLSLARMKNPKAVDILIELLSDEQVSGHAVIALGEIKARRSRPFIERLASHPKRWVRQAVQKALSRIDSQ